MLDLIKGGLAIFSAVFNFFIAFIVLLRNPRKAVNIVYFIIVFAFSVWCMCLFFYEFSFIFSSLFWIKATYFVAIIYLGMVFPFSYIFPTPSFRRAWPIAIFIGSSYFIFCFWLLFFTKEWVVDVVIDPVRGYQTILGQSYILWVYVSWAIVLWAMVNLIIKTRRAAKIEKIQMYYFWIGYILYAIGVSLIDVIFPLILKDSRFFIYSTVTSLFFSGATAYAIVKHRFMDIHLVVSRAISYFLLTLIFGIFYSLSLSLSATFLIHEALSVSAYVVFSILALIIALSFQPLLAFIQKTTNQIFYKQHYDETKLLYDLALTMASTVKLSELTDSLLDKILAELHISSGAFVLIDNKKIFHLNCRGCSSQPQFNEVELDRLIKQSKMVIFDELQENSLKEMMRKFKIAVIIPLRSREEHEDVLLLGEKLSGNPYTDQDISFFEVFSSAAAMAIKNSSNVERIMRLDELKSEFINVVSHQLRTPLSVARWNFELLMEKVFGKLPAKAENVVLDTYKTLMSLNKGLNNLMTVLEIEEGQLIIKPENININKGVIEEGIINLSKELKEKNITIKNHLAFEGDVKADYKKIKFVFEVILDNAIRYSPPNSTVVISSSLQKNNRAQEILISVGDEGMGVLQKNSKNIFTKFFRGEEAKKLSPDGFGLGLFMAQKYIEFHGGRLWFESLKDKGSIFNFTIPLKKLK